MPLDKKPYHILVIEDNSGDFTLVEDFLFERIEAPKIVQAKSHKEAKDILSNGDHKFDIILLDLSLPDKTGEALITDIVGNCSNTPVIVLTGYSDFDFGVLSLSLGISDYILKDELTPLSLYKSIIYNSERKRINSALLESEKKYSELFHFSPLPMWVFDVETMDFLDVNKAAVINYGYSREEFLSMKIKDIRPVEDVPRLEETIKKSIGKQGQVMQGIYRHRKKNGKIIHVDIQSNSFRYKGKDGKIVIANDVTDRLAYIKTIEDHNRTLKEISWMQSHIIRAPLSRIIGLIQLLKVLDETDDKNETEEILGYILASANELDDVIKDITEKSKEV